MNPCNNIPIICKSSTSIPRMRTVREAAQELKVMDPHTAMTSYHIRRLCIDGVIPVVKAGKKNLLDLDTLLEYMRNPTADKFNPRSAATLNGIRRVG